MGEFRVADRSNDTASAGLGGSRAGDARLRRRFGPFLYGLVFVAGVPALLVVWARLTAPAVGLPALQSLPWGTALVAGGLALAAFGMAALWVHGGGLPMNAYPPLRFVRRGIYRWLAHPIYAGFCLACAGCAIAAGSASGLWLVTPAAALGCIAIVLGYENADLERRFGPGLPAPRIALPADRDELPDSWERVAAYLLVLLPWLVLYSAVIFLGVPADARSAPFPYERDWPVWELTEIVYASTYPFVILAPLVVPTRRQLRRFMLRGWTAMAIVFPLFVTVPLVSPPRPFTVAGPLGRLLLFERAHDSAAAAFPSFHVAWAVVAAEAWASRWPPWRRLFRAFALLIAASCVTTGMHAWIDVAAGLAIGLLAVRYAAVWQWLRRAAERIAGSWREWRWGGVRIINHGLYAGIATAAGLAIAAAFLGEGAGKVVLVTAVAGLVGAAAWAQIVEGSTHLLRPFGFYGSLCGVLAACLSAPYFGRSPWLVLAAFGVAAPVIQGVGRLRCLVQGCCHGRPAPPQLGIRYSHPRSRVTRLAGFAGVPIHPTPLYSILWNVATALVLTRLALIDAPASMVAGLYLFLNGVGRFVEEAYRGEPQTPILGGLRLYQWLAVGSILLGVAFTMIPAAPLPEPRWTPESLVVAVVFGLLAAAALGVDFPDSQRRFSRLT